MELFDHEIFFDELAEGGLLRTMLADNSLAYQLKRLSKAELTEIRQQLQVKGLSKLPKDELAQALESAIIEALPTQLQLLDELLFEDLQTLVKKKGLLKDLTGVPPSTLFLLRKMGLAFTGVLENHGMVLIMPREVLMPCRQLLADEELRKTVFQNQKVLLICRGLLSYYGAVPVEQLRRMVEGMGISVSEPHFSRLLQTVGTGNGYIDYIADVVCDKRVIYVEEILREHLKRKEHGFYPVSLEQALIAAQQMYIDWTDAHRVLFEYLLEEHNLDEEAAAEELMFLIFALNNRVPIPTLLLRLSERQVELRGFSETIRFLTLLEQAYQDTRLWHYLGYTPAEMQEMEARPRLRVLTSSVDRSTKEE